MFTLCLEMGVPHPRYLIPWLSSPDVTDWLAFFEGQPFGPSREDERFGMLCALIRNQNRQKNEKPLRAQDFFPNFETRIMQEKASTTRSSPEHIAKVMGTFNKRFDPKAKPTKKKTHPKKKPH